MGAREEVQGYSIGAYTILIPSPSPWRDRVWEKIAIPGSAHTFVDPAIPNRKWFLGVIKRSDSRKFYMLGDYEIIHLTTPIESDDSIPLIFKELDQEAVATHIALQGGFATSATTTQKEMLRNLLNLYKNIILTEETSRKRLK